MIFFSLEEKLRSKLKMKSFSDILNQPHESIEGKMGDFSFPLIFSQILFNIDHSRSILIEKYSNLFKFSQFHSKSNLQWIFLMEKHGKNHHISIKGTWPLVCLWMVYPLFGPPKSVFGSCMPLF